MESLPARRIFCDLLHTTPCIAQHEAKAGLILVTVRYLTWRVFIETAALAPSRQLRDATSLVSTDPSKNPARPRGPAASLSLHHLVTCKLYSTITMFHELTRCHQHRRSSAVGGRLVLPRLSVPISRRLRQHCQPRLSAHLLNLPTKSSLSSASSLSGSIIPERHALLTQVDNPFGIDQPSRLQGLTEILLRPHATPGGLHLAATSR